MRSTLTHHVLRAGLLAVAGSLSLPALAVDFSWSGFGTFGYAQSNRGFNYQRYINEDGSWQRDSLLGGQLDLQLNPQWSATVQLTLAPSPRKDARWDLTPSWAFVGWRPSNDWLLRAGRLRLPLYMHSESLDVGAAHDMARLPTEMYSITPTNDFVGAMATKTWAQGMDSELSLDAYSGTATTHGRVWRRDGLPPYIPAGESYAEVKVKVNGLVLTLNQNELRLRAGLLHAQTRREGGALLPVSYPYVALPFPGLGYYQVDDNMPGPGVPRVASFRNLIATVGADYRFGEGWRLSAELARGWQHKTELGSDTLGGYLALSRNIEAFTPYVSIAGLRSSRGTLDWYDKLTSKPLPAFIPGAAQINAAQRMASEGIWVADQHSLALGSSYKLASHGKLKLEWMRTHVGRASRLIDTPPGQASPQRVNIDTVSLNYSFVF